MFFKRAIGGALVIALSLQGGRNAAAQVRGTFSGSAVQGMGTGQHKEPAPIILTVDTIDAWLATELPRLEARLKSARRGRVVGHGRHGSFKYSEKFKRYTFSSQAHKDGVIGRLQRKIENPLPGLWMNRIEEGRIGSLNECPGGAMYVGTTRYDVVQVIDNQTALIEARCGRARWLFRLRSAQVRTLRDDTSFDSLPGTFFIKGKIGYTTVLGARKMVHEVVEYDLSPHLQKYADAVAAREKQAARQKQPEYRTWTDASGEHETEAEFIGFTVGTVKLRKKDGKTITLKMEKLSEADQEWIRKRGRR